MSDSREKPRLQKVLDSMMYNSGESFKPADVQRVIRETMGDVAELMVEMEDEMLVQRLTASGKQQETIRYVRYSKARHMAVSLPWREYGLSGH
jgi:hypothetical protein